MQKTVLVLLILIMTAIPCFTQELEPDGLFSLQGTAWDSTAIISIVLPIPNLPIGESFDLGFYGGKVYMGPLHQTAPNPFSFYVDMVVASVFVDFRFYWGKMSFISGILFPNGTGTSVVIGGMLLVPFIALQIHELRVIDNNWTPPDVE